MEVTFAAGVGCLCRARRHLLSIPNPIGPHLREDISRQQHLVLLWFFPYRSARSSHNYLPSQPGFSEFGSVPSSPRLLPVPEFFPSVSQRDNRASARRVAVRAGPVSLATDILTCCSAAAAGGWQPARKPPHPHPHPLAHNLTFDLPPAPCLQSQAIPSSLLHPSSWWASEL